MYKACWSIPKYFVSAKQSAAQKMAARTQYKPPKPTGKRTSTSGGSSGYGQASSGYGPGGSYTQGYSQKQNSNRYFLE